METRHQARWARLIALLEPIHKQAVATARRLCRSSAEGDDLFQDTVLRAFEKLHTLRDESKFRSWFYATLLSRHRTRMRASFWRRWIPWETAFPDGLEPAGEDGTEWGIRAGGAARARRALESLPVDQRQAIVLFDLDGFSIEEVARMQRASVPAVKSRLARGRERLRGWYARHGFGSSPGPAADRAASLLASPGLAIAEAEEKVR